MSSPLAILVILIVLLVTGTYLQYGTTPVTASTIIRKTEHSLPPVIYHARKQVELPSVPNTVIDEACQQVDFQWLAGDRSFWDGWSSRSMFMKKNGQFTRKNIRIQQDDSICITVLLGPIPAVSSIKIINHYAPSDTIVMTAKGESGASIPVTLKQHPKQSNAYFASVKFSLADKYTLDTSVEYRSYFWKFPLLHHYLPNKFTSRNALTVVSSDSVQPKQECNLLQYPQALANSVWTPEEFLPSCELKSQPLTGKTIHVWGDDELKRNVQFLKGDISSGDMCDNGPDHTFDVNAPLEVHGNALYFGQVNTIITDTLEEYQHHIHGIAQQLPQADYVILGVGNHDVGSAWQSPNDFAVVFKLLVDYLTENVYTNDEMIIVKTSQYVGSSGPDRGWHYGRSEAYANIIRYTVAANPRTVLWDTHHIGLSDHTVCNVKHRSTFSVLQVENAMLVDILSRLEE